MTNTPNKDHPEQHLDMVREDFEAWWREWGLGGEEVQWEAYQAATQRSAARIAELEAEVQALSLDAFAKDASIGHLSRLVDTERTDAARYQWLRNRDLETISLGGVFAGKTPENVILNGEDLDRAIDAASEAERTKP